MKLKNLMAALENYEEAPIPESVAAIADGDIIDPQAVADIDAPVNEPSTIPDAGELPLGIPDVSPLPIIEEPVAEIPAAVEGEGDTTLFVEETAGPVDLVIDSPIDHDDTMAMMDQTIVEQTQLGNELGEIVETQVALEAYAKLMRQAGPDGITRQAAGFMRVSLEQFHHDGHIDFSKLIGSMEDMGDGEKQHLLPSKLKSNSLGDKIKEVAGKVWEWLKKTWEKAKQFVEKLRNGVIGLERKLNAAKKAATAAGNKSGATFTVPNPGRIAVGNKVEINYPDSLKAVSALACKVYPERMTQFYNAVASTISNFNPTSGDPAEITSLLEKAKGLLEDIKFSDTVLPGNVKIDVSEDGISFGITEAESVDVGETKASARSGSTINSQLTTMGVVLDGLKGYYSRHEEMAAAAAKVGEALKKLKAVSGGTDMEKGAAETASNIESQVGQLVHKANPRGNEIIRYLARTTSAYADVILAELNVDGKTTDVAVA